MKKYWVLIYLIIIQKNLNAQEASSLVFSQNSNYHFFESTHGFVYVGSADGLNVSDGLSNKIYRPYSHSMIGRIIQGNFIEDKNGRVWFATYQGINFHDPTIDDVVGMRLVDSLNNIIETDYRVIHISGDTLWVQAENYTQLLDINNNHILSRFVTKIPEVHAFQLKLREREALMYAGGKEGLYSLRINLITKKVDKKKLSDFNIRSLLLHNDKLYVGTTHNGLYLYNSNSQKLEKLYSTNNTIVSILPNYENLIICAKNEGSFIFDTAKIKLLKKNKIYNKQDQFNDANYTAAYLAKNNILWEGIINQGPKFYSINKSKFGLLTTSSSVNSIDNYKNEIIIGLRSKGYLKLDSNGNIISKSFNEKNPNTYYSPSSILDISDKYYFFNNGIQSIDLDAMKIKEKVENSKIKKFIRSVSTLGNKIIFSNNDTLILSFDVGNDDKRYDTIYQSKKYLTNAIVHDNYIYTSNNNQKIISLKSKNDVYVQNGNEIEISGQLKFVSESHHQDSIFITTENGLFIVDKETHSFRMVLDNNGFLQETIYAAYLDSKNNIWCSSNLGILKYDPITNNTYQFTKKDGIQGYEYNTNAHLQLEDGTILFGGINGLNIFHPDSIKWSDYQAPVILTDFSINNISTSKYGVPFSLDTLSLTYEENTISFSFHAIDYSSPTDTRVKYKLIGEDNKYVNSTSAYGFARYPNLDPGQYELSIIGSNADGIWNLEDKKIHITIHPPYWQTWWFRLLALIAIGSVIWLSFKSYYKRQLERKDLKLREQRLQIEKQAALQAERSRIAGEMHDDLGGGLTSIKFLSQKLQKQLIIQEDKNQLDKIINHSQNLVDNISEIIWAMNSRFDTMQDLIVYSRRFSKEFLDTHGVELHFKVTGDAKNIELAGEKRRNLFLILKETLHNVVKHSKATTVFIDYKIHNQLTLRIQDNGTGIKNINKYGNGIKNMQSRANKIQGNISFLNNEKGLLTLLHIDLKS